MQLGLTGDLGAECVECADDGVTALGRQHRVDARELDERDRHHAVLAAGCVAEQLQLVRGEAVGEMVGRSTAAEQVCCDVVVWLLRSAPDGVSEGELIAERAPVEVRGGVVRHDDRSGVGRRLRCTHGRDRRAEHDDSLAAGTSCGPG